MAPTSVPRTVMDPARTGVVVNPNAQPKATMVNSASTIVDSRANQQTIDVKMTVDSEHSGVARANDRVNFAIVCRAVRQAPNI